MIKTFINKNSEELDTLVNAFMTIKKSNLPVRTETYIASDGVTHHKAVVFYNESFPADSEVGTEVPGGTSPVSKPEKVGALWYQNDGKLTGLWKDKSKIEIDEKTASTLAGGSGVDTAMKGVLVRIIKNKFKDTAKHPDFVLMTR